MAETAAGHEGGAAPGTGSILTSRGGHQVAPLQEQVGEGERGTAPGVGAAGVVVVVVVGGGGERRQLVGRHDGGGHVLGLIRLGCDQGRAEGGVGFVQLQFRGVECGVTTVAGRVGDETVGWVGSKNDVGREAACIVLRFFSCCAYSGVHVRTGPGRARHKFALPMHVRRIFTELAIGLQRKTL